MVTITGMSKQFGERLQEAINRAGMTKYRLAKETGISQVQIGRLVSGDRDATPDAVQAIAPILGIPIEEMQAWADADRLGEDRLKAVQEHVIKPESPAVPRMTVDELIAAIKALPPEEKAKARPDIEAALKAALEELEDGETK